MSMDLAVKTFTHTPGHFEAGTMPVAKAVKTASEDIPAHAPVVLDEDGKLALLSVSGETVTTTGLYGIVPEDIGADEEGPVYLTGEFYADSLALPEGATAADVEIPLRNIGIFIR